MSGGILDPHAKVATAAVNVEHTSLENRGRRMREEVGERDEVARDQMQVALVAGQPMQVIDSRDLVTEFFVFFNEFQQLGLHATL